jgi:hypothetical protein
MVVKTRLLKEFCKKYGLKLKDDGSNSLLVDVLFVTLTQPDALWNATLAEFQRANDLQEKLDFLSMTIEKFKE